MNNKLRQTVDQIRNGQATNQDYYLATMMVKTVADWLNDRNNHIVGSSEAVFVMADQLKKLYGIDEQ